MVFTPRQKQVVLGTTFGDGCLWVQSTQSYGKIVCSGNAAFKTSCRDPDKEYIFWKYEELRSTGLFAFPSLRFMRSYSNPHYPYWVLRARVHPYFTELRKLFYPDGKKIIPEGPLGELDDLGLAVWYMDDGGLYIRRKAGWGPGREYPCIWLNTQGFTLTEDKLIRNWLEAKWDFHFFVARIGKNHRLGLHRKKECERFLDLVRPHIVPCMSRKLKKGRGK